MKFSDYCLKLLCSFLALTTLFQSAAKADDGFVEVVAEAPIYVSPSGSSTAVFTDDGRLIGPFRGAGDDVAFGLDANGEAKSGAANGFPLGFEVNFYGKPYSTIFPTTNGIASFSGPNWRYYEDLAGMIQGQCSDIGVQCANGTKPATAFSVLAGDLLNGWNLNIAKSSSLPDHGVYWGQTTIDGKPAFAITYYGTTPFPQEPNNSQNPETSNSGYFQLVIQSVGNNGDFNAYFNYDFLGDGFMAYNNESPNVIAGYGITTNTEDPAAAQITSIFATPIVRNTASSSAANISAGTALQLIRNNSTVNGRYVLYMRSGQSFNDVQQLVAAGFTEDAGAPAPLGPTPDFIFMFDPQDKTSKARIGKQGSQLTCSAGKYRFGLPGSEADFAYKGLTYRLFVDGNLVESTTSDDSSVTWDISKLTATGLATCSVSMTLMGTTLVDTSDGNRNIGNNAVATKANQRSSTVLAHSKQLQDALAALSKARTQIRASFEKQRISINADHQAKMDQLKSSLAQGSIDSKAYAQGVRTLKAAYQEKLSAATTAYKGSLESNTRASSGAADASQSQLVQALKAIDATYAQSLEDAGYGVVVP